MEIRIEPMRADDGDGVLAVYREGIETGDATFETAAPPWPEWDRNHLENCRFVARAGDRVVGWAALSPITDRCAYRGVAEVSVYVGAGARGHGIGRRLLSALVEESERQGFWTLQAGMFAENTASLALHRACGFREVGRRERLGKLAGVWRDVMLFERRSPAFD